MKNETKFWTVNKILVEATKSEGGKFYDVKVVETGTRMRYLASVFESVAKEAKSETQKREGPSQA